MTQYLKQMYCSWRIWYFNASGTNRQKKKGRGAPDAEPMLTASKKGFIVLFGIQLQKKREFPTVKLGSLQAKKNFTIRSYDSQLVH